MEELNKIKVSVLVPVYNVERFLPRCLDSLLAQTLREIEIVCVNDASPDNSAAILRDYAARDSRVRIITKTKNEGLMMARKTGYLAARGEFLCFCDSDDYMAPNSLELLYKAASNEHTDIAVGEMYLENNQGRHVLRPRAHVEGRNADNYLRAILNWTTCSLCGSLFRRELFVGKEYDTRMHQSFSEDRMLLTQLLIKNNPASTTVETPTYYYCLNHESITRRKLSEDALRQQLTALFNCYDYVHLHKPQFEEDNRNFIIRYLSLYAEKGASTRLIKHFNPTAEHLLKFDVMSQATSPRFALHTLLCLNCSPYREACTVARKTIRKLQGKD
jgi:glycosyltransferase involved in cell wall biosynthesis